jgi:diaminohydroxyphosphoribosylaminopyrimidine deaminase / 5-amino-6-(5-phosphoribosylamino)uracil reductase
MKTVPDRDDRRWMREALRLASKGEGWTRPNPPVGAVVVKNGRAIGRGWHQKAGGPHAEVFALAEAGQSARDAILYVTLEPCSSWGRTPPCTEAIIRSGIRRVVAGTGDPNPRHASQGFVILEKAGVSVSRGVLEAECRRLIAPFGKWIRTGLPYLTLKLGMTVDGRIADANGKSRWITGPEARQQVQKLRRRADAILVGARTVRADNPSLLPKGENPNPVFRVIVDGAGIVPPESTVLTDARASETILATTSTCSVSRCRKWAANGAAVWRLPSRNKQFRLSELIRRLGKMGLLHVVCEGGGELAEGLIREGLVDEYRLFYAPRILGGGALPGIGGTGWALAGAPELTFDSIARAGRDILVTAHPRPRGEESCSQG